jgi:mono/diheme cytochrome c family protein
MKGMALLAALGLSIVAADRSAWSQDAQASDVANGKLVYMAVGCFACHGRNGQGGAFAYPAPPLAELEMPIEAFQAFLREAPNDMPSYSVAVLSDTDATDVLAFLRSLPGRKPVRDFPLLNQ